MTSSRALLRSPALLCAAGGLLAAEIMLLLAKTIDLPAALGFGARVALGLWLLYMAANVVRAMTCWRPTTLPAVPSPEEAGIASWKLLTHEGWRALQPWQVIGVGAALIAAALQRAPSRMLVNVVGYAMVAVPLLWIVSRRATPTIVLQAALALVIFAFGATHVDLPRGFGFEHATAHDESDYRWPVGWPTGEWRLRHVIHLDQPLANEPLLLAAELADKDANGGDGHLDIAVNGRDLGPIGEVDRGYLNIRVPGGVAARATELVIELRPSGTGAPLRLSAQRWTAGATLGAGASNFFDGAAWHPGTYDATADRERSGVYLIRMSR